MKGRHCWVSRGSSARCVRCGIERQVVRVARAWRVHYIEAGELVLDVRDSERVPPCKAEPQGAR